MQKVLFTPFLVALLAVFSCDSDTHTVKYSVTADVNVFPARISYLNNQQESDTLFAIDLPWSFSFEAESGDRVQLSADIVNQGNISFTGVDTMRLKIFIDGSVLTQANGVIQYQNMQTVTVQGVIAD